MADRRFKRFSSRSLGNSGLVLLNSQQLVQLHDEGLNVVGGPQIRETGYGDARRAIKEYLFRRLVTVMTRAPGDENLIALA